MLLEQRSYFKAVSLELFKEGRKAWDKGRRDRFLVQRSQEQRNLFRQERKNAMAGKGKQFLALMLSAGLVLSSAPGAQELVFSGGFDTEAAQDEAAGTGGTVQEWETQTTSDSQELFSGESDLVALEEAGLEETGLYAGLEAAGEEDLSFLEGDGLVEASLEDALVFTDELDLFAEEAEELVEAVTLDKVTGLKVSISPANGYFKLRYNAVDGATNYTGAYKEISDTSWTKVKSGGETTVTLEGLERGKLYKLRIKATKGKNTSEAVYRFRWLQKPSVSLEAGENALQVNIKADGGAGEVSYRVYVSENEDMSGSTMKVYEKTDETTSVTVDSLEGGKTYYVRVRPLCVYEGRTYLGKTSAVKSVQEVSLISL